MQTVVRPTFASCLVIAIALIAISCALLPTSASAAYAMPITLQTPANNSTLALSPYEGSTDVQIIGPHSVDLNLLGGMQLEVSRSTALGTDGSLSDDGLVDFDAMHLVDGWSNVYRGSMHNWKFSLPGIYYFQISVPDSFQNFLVSPIYQFNYVPGSDGKPDLSMSLKQAGLYIRDMAKRNTGHKARNLARTCDRINFKSWTCHATFYAGPRRYQGKFILKHVDIGGVLYYSGKFTGQSAKVSCLRSRGAAACSKSVRWKP